jgi:hypothetical protein
MTKKLAALAVVAFVTAGLVFAQELVISGEMKTGFFWEKIDVDGEERSQEAKMHNNDDAGQNQGRFRMNLHLHKENNMGMKVRFEQTVWTAKQPNEWAYAMAYGNFISDQLRVTVGKLGESPWGAGGPDIWDELDNQVGIRTEIMPNAAPGLDIGFVLGNYNEATYNAENVDNKLVDMLGETVFGVAYTNDNFHGRLSYRLDGDVDVVAQNTNRPGTYIEDNMAMIYRLEERIIRKYLEGFSIWANGYWKGIGEDSDIDNRDSVIYFQNWLYIDYSPEDFSSQLRFGLHFNKGVSTFIGRGSFYYNIFPFLSAGAAVNYRQEFGEDAQFDDKPFMLWGVEPQVRVTFNPNAYIAFVYNYEQKYVNEGLANRILQDRQWINLRVVYTF